MDDIDQDGISKFKANQKIAWASFALLENLTGTAAPHLIHFAGIHSGQKVLDVACGTGVVTLTAARATWLCERRFVVSERSSALPSSS